MKNHYQQSPRCRPTATTMATRQNTYINNTEIIDTETNSDNICQSDDNSDTSSDIIINDQVSTYNNMDINASNNNIEQYLLGKEIRVPIDDNVYNIYQGNQEYSMLRLLDYCEKALCPHYFFDGLIKIIREENVLRQFDIMSKNLPSQNTLVSTMTKNFKTPIPLISEVIPELPQMTSTIVNISSAEFAVEVVHYNFLESLKCLLNDRTIFGIVDNLVINTTDPFHPYVPQSPESIDEVLDGQWYKDTVQSRIKEDMKDTHFLFPIYIYIDKTPIDKNVRYGLEPVVFSTPIIKRSVRQDPKCYRLLGFIPDLCSKSSALRSTMGVKKANKGMSNRNYHQCLSIVLESLKQAQQNPPLIWLRIGDRIKNLRLVIVVAFVSGDGLSNDALCGRKQSYVNSPRLCRACNTPSRDADNAFHVCQPIHKRSISSLTELVASTSNNITETEFVDSQVSRYDKLIAINIIKTRKIIGNKVLEKIFGCHRTKNAFENIDFGNNGGLGIYGSTPTDLMHAFEEGIIPYILHIVFDPMSNKLLSEIDIYMDSLLSKEKLRSSEREYFPRINFTRGFSRLTLLTAAEKIGALMALVIFIRTPIGRQILLPRFRMEKTTQVAVSNIEINESNPESESSNSDFESDTDENEVIYDNQNEIHRNMVSQYIEDLQMGDIISNVKKSLNQKQIVELYEIIFYHTKGDVSSHTLIRLPSLDNPVEMNITDESDLYNYTPYQRSSPISQLRIQQSTSARNNVGLLCNIDQFTNMCKELLCLHSLYKNYNQDCYITKSQFIDTLDGLVRNILHKVITYLQ